MADRKTDPKAEINSFVVMFQVGQNKDNFL